MQVWVKQDYLDNWYAITIGDDDIEWYDPDEDDEEEYLDVSSNRLGR